MSTITEKVSINPDICKKCRNKWQFIMYKHIEMDDSKFYQKTEKLIDGEWYIHAFFCVSSDFLDAFGNHLKLVPIEAKSAEELRKNQSLFLKSYKNGYEEIFETENCSAITLKVDKINNNLKEACKNVLVFKGSQCPYYAEHLLSEWCKK